MDGNTLKEKIWETLKKIPPFYYLPIGVFLCGLIFLGIGLIQINKKNTDDIDAPQQNLPQITSIPQQVTIDVEGAVIHPGVYSLPMGSRIKDALIAAGGLGSDADREAVAKGLNLAVKVTDGAKIYIPKIGDISLSQGSATTQVLGTTTGLVNINTATAEELDNLPGVGQVTAQKIISERPYQSIDELLAKKVVSNSVFQKIKDKIGIF